MSSVPNPTSTAWEVQFSTRGDLRWMASAHDEDTHHLAGKLQKLLHLHLHGPAKYRLFNRLTGESISLHPDGMHRL